MKASWSTIAKRLKDASPKFRIVQSGKTWDLSKIDFDKLKEDFKRATYKNIEIADLRAFIQHKLDQMLQAERDPVRLRHSGCRHHRSPTTPAVHRRTITLTSW